MTCFWAASLLFDSGEVNSRLAMCFCTESNTDALTCVDIGRGKPLYCLHDVARNLCHDEEQLVCLRDAPLWVGARAASFKVLPKKIL